MDEAGNLYGTTSGYGTKGGGTVFELTPPAAGQTQWNERELWSFGGAGDGSKPYGGVVMFAGRLYGTTYYGGKAGVGTIFQITPNATDPEVILYEFCSQGGGLCTDGSSPEASLIVDQYGNLYTTTLGGGAYGKGTVFELISPGTSQTEWTPMVRHDFCGAACKDGSAPKAALLMKGDLTNGGKLYGTTSTGGANGEGTVFELTPSATTKWSETYRYSFCSQQQCADGGAPSAGLVTDASGNLYGTTFAGGAHNAGTVFRLTPGAINASVLWAFCSDVQTSRCIDGIGPVGGLVINSGNLYGTTWMGGANGFGTVFQR
jgi:uncharacterized repeat protein (TIGR03803 family)